MNLKDYDYNLPEELIASYPVEKRDHSRIMITQVGNNERTIMKFHEIIDQLDENYHLVFNDTKVLQARLFGKRKTGGSFEILLEHILDIEKNSWKVIGKNIKKIKDGEVLFFNNYLTAKFISKQEMILEFSLKYEEFDDWLKENGHLPLPPYILRLRESKSDEEIDKTRYQTVYAKNNGAVAAPTAGLHFTDKLLQKIKDKNITSSKVTLHVGLGTFMPIKTDEILDHQMHIERYSVTEEAAKEINSAKKMGKKIVAVGTTSLRTLEAATKDGVLNFGSGDTDLFVYPGYEFKMIDGLITNYHLPKSTLLLLVAALYGRDNLFEAYDYAIENSLRFYSYGDSMFIKPKN